MNMFALKNREKIEIRALTSADWDAVRAIYRDGIVTGQATFETLLRPGRNGIPITCPLPAWSQSLEGIAGLRAGRR